MNGKSTIGERIEALRKHLNISDRKFAVLIGVSPAAIAKITKGTSKPGFDVLDNILMKTKVSNDWLMRDEGPMFLDDRDILAEESGAKMVGRLSDMEIIELPMIDAKAAASFTDNIYQDLSQVATLKKYPVLKVFGHSYENAYAMEIEGESMYPTYKPGTIVIVREVPNGRWEYATGVHAVSIKQNMFTIKRIIRNTNMVITLKADNSLTPEEYNVQLADVLCMFKVGEIVYAPAE